MLGALLGPQHKKKKNRMSFDIQHDVAKYYVPSRESRLWENYSIPLILSSSLMSSNCTYNDPPLAQTLAKILHFLDLPSDSTLPETHKKLLFGTTSMVKRNKEPKHTKNSTNIILQIIIKATAKN